MSIYDMSFRDYILAKEKFKSSNQYEKSKKYWLDRIYEIQPDPSLPLSINPGMIKEPEFKRHNYSTLMLHELFEKQAALYPERIAVADRKALISYGYLAKISLKLAYFLRDKDVKPDQLVAIVMEKGWEQVAAVLGILQSGAAFLPIDHEIPNERRIDILQDAKVETVLTQPKLKRNLSHDVALNYECLTLNDLYFKRGVLKSLAPLQTIDNLAYVIYTSGSTGKPKGVMIEHKGAVNRILDINSRFNLTSTDKVLSLSNLNSDLSIYDIFGMLSAGGTIVFPDPKRVNDPSHWIELIKKEEVTVWNTVPILVQMLVESVQEKDELSNTLNLILMSRDRIPPDLPGKVKTIFNQAAVISLGGTTGIIKKRQIKRL
ncbi:MAG: AMP-binding protein [Desulfobacterales bacterium]|nr:AMP-binding protein [Desulfobacterales bacterium]